MTRDHGPDANRLHALYDEQGQSPWLDNLKRDWLRSGRLADWVGSGVRGLTSNPSIFQKAIEGSDAYDDQLRGLLADGASVEQAYWQLVTDDIRGALEVFAPLHRASDGLDGYVSLEVDPSLADDTEATEGAARHLHLELAAPNLLVKIPGTAAGLPAIHTMIAEGHSINVTLLFSVDRYREVMEAYVSGLEAAEGPLGHIASVASFFISRVDTEVDRRLEAIGTEEALALRGRAAVANGKLAYQAFVDTFSGPRWSALRARGARVQRPLWASTSTKNPDYPDTLYVDDLIGPHTVNTLPDPTLDAFLDHGLVRRTVDVGVDEARATLDAIAGVGVDLHDVTDTLERQGVAAFVEAFDGLLGSLRAKAGALT